MDKRTKIAIVVSLTLPLAMVMFLLFHHPRKPVRPDRFLQAPSITELVGVGIALRMDAQTHAAIIQEVVPNTPAAEAGISKGLMVSKADGISLEGKPLAECVKLIRGPVGTTVQLELVTPDRSQTNTVELTRRKIELPNGKR